jgi:hypothetical protein
MSNPPPTSAIRVLGKSMHVFAIGWLLTVGWLWIAGIQQHAYRHPERPANYALPLIIIGGIFPALFLAFCGWVIGWLSGRAPDSALNRREWWHAFWWAAFPNALMAVTVEIMIRDLQ